MRMARKYEMLMAQKYRLPATVLFQAVIGCFLMMSLSRCSDPVRLSTATANIHDIRVIASTNGVIEPTDSTGIYAPVDGFVKTIHGQEGSQVERGRTFMLLDASQIRISLAEAQAALLEARRQARMVVDGPPREETDAADASIEECSVQIRQVRENLEIEEALLSNGAVSRESVEALRKQLELLELRAAALKRNKENLLARYSEDEKKWEQDKVAVLAGQVKLLESQLKDESVTIPQSGVLYSLLVKQGSFVARGQLMAQIYTPGHVRLRAYVDEPDLGRIQKGQPITITWDGMPGRQWTGKVEVPAERVVAQNNRSVGHVLCAIDGDPRELIPDINVKVEITTDMKTNALMVPRSAVFSREGKSAVLLSDGTRTTVRPVEVGLVTNEEIEILQGIEPGASVVTNPDVVLAGK
jgi:HlyD family secretion protein